MRNTYPLLWMFFFFRLSEISSIVRNNLSNLLYYDCCFKLVMNLIFGIFWLSQQLTIHSYVAWLHRRSVETDGAGLLCHSLVPPPPYCVKCSLRLSVSHVLSKRMLLSSHFCSWVSSLIFYSNIDHHANYASVVPSVSSVWLCLHFIILVPVAYRGGVWGVQTSPQNSEGPPKSCQTQPDCENC